MVSQLIDIESGLYRTGNDYSFYIRHLRRFLNDTNMEMLCDALNRGDMKQSFFFAIPSRASRRSSASSRCIIRFPPCAIFCARRTPPCCRRRKPPCPELLSLYDQVIREIETY